MHAGAAGNPGARPLLLGTVLMLLFLTISVSGRIPPLLPSGLLRFQRDTWLIVAAMHGVGCHSCCLDVPRALTWGKP